MTPREGLFVLATMVVAAPAMQVAGITSATPLWQDYVALVVLVGVMVATPKLMHDTP